MSNLRATISSDYKLLKFLRQNPALSSSLLADYQDNLQEITLIVEPVLKAPTRCQIASFYVQAVSLGYTGFLATNLPSRGREVCATKTATGWLVGRALTSEISIADRSVSRCHAVISHDAHEGFFITDVGSKNGTWVNGRRLPSQERKTLHDGDLLQFGNVSAEFFSTFRGEARTTIQDITYC